MAESLASKEAASNPYERTAGVKYQEHLSSMPLVGHLFGDPGVDAREATYRSQANAYAQQGDIARQRTKAAQQAGYQMGQGYRDALQSQYNTQPGYGENWFGQNQGYFASGDSALRDAYNPGNYTKPGDAEQYWNGVAGSLRGATNTTGALAGAEGRLMGGPSTVEQFVNRNLNQFQAPTYTEAALGQAQQQGSTAGQRSAELYDQFQANPSGLSGYYDRAVRDSTQDINASLAAQGVLGSSVGANTVADAVAGLRAEQARAEGEYGLEQYRVASQLAQGADQGIDQGARLTADLATAADSAALAKMLGGVSAGEAASNQELARTQAFGNLASSADKLDIDRLLAGGSLSSASQDAALQRYLAQTSAAGQLDQAQLARIMAGTDASRTAQQLQQSREQDALAAIFRGEQADIARNDSYAQYLQGLDDQYFDAVMASKLGAVGVRPTGAEQRANQLGELSQGVNVVASLYSGGAG